MFKNTKNCKIFPINYVKVKCKVCGLEYIKKDSCNICKKEVNDIKKNDIENFLNLKTAYI
jgi:hypothetical protein